jgi:hypothetical protein
MSGIFVGGVFFENVGLMCPTCKRILYGDYYCFHCDTACAMEDAEEHAYYPRRVQIARPVGDEQLGFVRDVGGEVRWFNDQADAETYLLAHRFSPDELKHFYFIEDYDPEDGQPMMQHP